MKLRLIVIVENFRIEKEGTIEYKGLTLKPGNSIAADLQQDLAFIAAYGTIAIGRIEPNYVFEGRWSLPEGFSYSPDEWILMAKGYMKMLSDIINNLWYVKDNGSHISALFLYEAATMQCKQLFSYDYQCLASGKSAVTNFTIPKLDWYLTYYPRIDAHIRDSEDSIEVVELKTETNPPSSEIDVNFVPYNFTRTYRAMVFIHQARTSLRVIQKIAHYMSAFECLFTSNNKNVSERVRERASKFIGGSEETILANENLIKAAYKIRSLFLHGEKIQRSIQELEQLSIGIDTLTRTLMLIVLEDDERTEIFKIDESGQGKKAFEKYFEVQASKK